MESSAFDAMFRSISSEPGIALGALGIIAGCLTGVIIAATTVIAIQWRRVRQSEDVSALKQYMLERGMSAEEITAVIAAAPKSRLSLGSCNWNKSPPPFKSPERQPVHSA